MRKTIELFVRWIWFGGPMRTLAFWSMALIVGVVPTAAQPSVPEARIYHSMVSIGQDEGNLLIGGVTRHGWTMDLQDVWALNSRDASWRFVGRMEPGDLYAAAYDSQSDRVITLALDGETWAFDPASERWERMSPEVAPSGRCGHRIVYDRQSDRVILFGGFACTAVSDPMSSDTWAYDYESNRWDLVETPLSPPARIYHAMTYHPGLDRVFLWGGRVEDHAIWSFDFDSRTWQSHGSAGAPGGYVAYQTLSYEPTLDALVAFGGLRLDAPLSFEGKLLNDTWVFDPEANQWRRLSPDQAPSPRSHHSASLDPISQRILVFGGELEASYSGVMSDEIWAFDPVRETWTPLRAN